MPERVMMKQKQYWYDVVKDPRFTHVAITGTVILLLIVVLIVNDIFASSSQKKLIKETENAEIFYNTDYAVKYEQLVNTVNGVFSPGGTLNLCTLSDSKYSLIKEKDKVVLTCEFEGDPKKKENPYIIITTLTSNYEMLSQKTNQMSKEEYIQNYLNEKVFKQLSFNRFMGYCLVFGICYIGFFTSIIISKKNKEKEQYYLQSTN